jgi:hypothetical protein
MGGIVVSLNGVGLMDFQLYLLKTMNPPSALLSGALDRLERSAEGMVSSYKAVSPLLMMREGQFQSLEEILEEARQEDLSENDHEHIYRIPLWPEFAFKVCADESGLLIYSAEFTRVGNVFAGDGPEVWKFLKCDLPVRFPNARAIDLWSPYESYAVGDRGEIFLRFGWGLLQEIDDM